MFALKFPIQALFILSRFLSSFLFRRTFHIFLFQLYFLVFVIERVHFSNIKSTRQKGVLISVEECCQETNAFSDLSTEMRVKCLGYTDCFGVFDSNPFFSPMFHFYTPWKRQKTFGFLKFSGGIKMEHLAETG